MKTKTKIVRVTYQFGVRYEHEEHAERIVKELRDAPILDRGGAGIASDGECYSYGCRRIGKGEIHEAANGY